MSIILKVLLWIAIVTVLLVALMIYGFIYAIKNDLGFEIVSASVSNGVVYISTTNPNAKIGNIKAGTTFNIQRQVVTHSQNSTNTNFTPVLSGTISTVAQNPHGGWLLTGKTSDTTYKFHHSDNVNLL